MAKNSRKNSRKRSKRKKSLVKREFGSKILPNLKK